MIPGDSRHNKLEMDAEREAWEREQRKTSDGDRMLQYKGHQGAERLLVDESKRYGLEIDGKPIGWWALLRHLYNNHDAIVGMKDYTIRVLQERLDEAERRRP